MAISEAIHPQWAVAQCGASTVTTIMCRSSDTTSVLSIRMLFVPRLHRLTNVVQSTNHVALLVAVLATTMLATSHVVYAMHTMVGTVQVTSGRIPVTAVVLI